MNEFKDMLKYLRKRENLSQAELALKLGLAKSTISMYEVGKREPDIETLECIADFFNVDMNFLLGRSKDEPSYYLNSETAKMAQEIYENPNYRVLFDASKNLSSSDIQFVVDMIDRMKGNR